MKKQKDDGKPPPTACRGAAGVDNAKSQAQQAYLKDATEIPGNFTKPNGFFLPQPVTPVKTIGKTKVAWAVLLLFDGNRSMSVCRKKKSPKR